ncbi:hypothetical protein KUTeg_022333 [Tegillarca granosa]|uniref:Uncharacterized protein n=1 Tax=Tegillarca granosa TaxID=220873 RepID=A0ABQ9E5Y1_TEGGR|nr:hypothetical protein KUTeg_022333 [Tegillarca granosa]
MIENKVDEFLEEISEVNDLFFGNVVVTGETSCENDTDTHGESDSDSESEGNLEFNVDDARQTDVTEHNVTSQFRRKTCGCTSLYNGRLIDYRNHCQEMSKEELDVVIKIQLFHHRHNDVNTYKKKHKVKEKEQ